MLRKNQNSIKNLFLIVMFISAVKVSAISVKFTLDMSYQIKAGTFNSAIDKVYLRGSFNNWDLSNEMKHEGNGVYTVSITMPENSWCEYKFFTNATNFPNGGYESNVGIAQDKRSMNLGSNDLVLAKLYFNNANMILHKNTAHFELFCQDEDVAYADTIGNYLEENFPRITNALESTIEQKVKIWVYPDQKTYFVHKGYPDSPDWSVGGAVGKNDVLIFSPRYSFSMQGVLGTANHEFTHIAVAWKIKTIVPSWLNEGAATFYSDDPPVRPVGSIQDIVNNKLGGVKPPLSYIEQASFGDGNGYPLSFSIADFIFTKHGAHALANFLINLDYSVLGYASKEAFQNEWHKFLDKYYLAQQVYLKLSVDMGYYISKGWFNPQSEKVFVGGNFTNWYPFQTISEGNGIYSFSTTSPQNMEYQYKFKINTSGAVNQGWEENVGNGTNGSRVVQVTDKNLTSQLIPFNNINNALTVLSPNGDEAFIAGDSTYIKWKYTSIPNIRIEFSSNNGSNWSEIVSSYSAAKCSFGWLVPNVSTSSAKLRIVDVTNNSIVDESDKPFKIVKPNSIGGPYLYDSKTVLLMHFENDYTNVASIPNSGNPNNAVSFITSEIGDLNKALKVDNSAGRTCVTVPNYPEINLTSSWTIECWFYINNIGSGNYAFPVLFMKGSSPFVADYMLSLSSDGKNITASYSNTLNAEEKVTCGSIQSKKWLHVAFIRDANKKTLSLVVRDQKRKIISSNSITDDTTPKNTPYGLLIGGLLGGSNMNFDGYIDELRISNVERDYTVGIESNEQTTLPNQFLLKQNYPNPFNPSTMIEYSIPRTAFVSLKIYDVLGKEIKSLVNEEKQPGNYEVKFDGSDLASGVYLYTLQAENFFQSHKLVLIK